VAAVGRLKETIRYAHTNYIASRNDGLIEKNSHNFGRKRFADLQRLCEFALVSP
jgi:hypothetical protein